jgi:hypothetical protein
MSPSRLLKFAESKKLYALTLPARMISMLITVMIRNVSLDVQPSTNEKRGERRRFVSKLNLTAGPPRKMAAVQTYVKHYWQSKVKQEVIDKWAPTAETDLFDEADIGEDQVGWEALTPMEKNIPLWFRMKVGREMYEAESDEVKAEIDQLESRRRMTQSRHALLPPTCSRLKRKGSRL